MRVFVEVLHIRVGRRAVEIEVVFLDVLAVVTLAVGQAEQPLLEDRVLAVPQCKSKTQPLVVITETGEAVLAPMIGARAGLVVGEIIPCIPVLAVVLANRAPLALAEVRPPLLPGHPLLVRLIQTHLFRSLDPFGAGPLGHSLLLRAIIGRCWIFCPGFASRGALSSTEARRLASRNQSEPRRAKHNLRLHEALAFVAPAANQQQNSHNGCGGNRRQSLRRSRRPPIVGYRLEHYYDAIAAILVSPLRARDQLDTTMRVLRDQLDAGPISASAKSRFQRIRGPGKAVEIDFTRITCS